MTYTAPERGYIQVFVANASDQEVFFDQMEVEHIPQLIVQENHYYPFGLELSGLTKKGKPEHKFKYNGVENEQTFGLNWNETHFRSYDLQLGRWHQIDPKNSARESAYVGMGNNPAISSDPLGDTTRVFNLKGGFLGTINSSSTNQAHFISANMYNKFKENSETFEKNVRGNSVAFVGQRSFHDVRVIAQKTEAKTRLYIWTRMVDETKASILSPQNSKAEQLFIALKYNKDKQLSFFHVPMPLLEAVRGKTSGDENGEGGKYFLDYIPTRGNDASIKKPTKWIEKSLKMGLGRGLSVFGAGHSHYDKGANISLLDLGEPTGSGSRGGSNGPDYNPLIGKQSPLFIISKYGLTIYPSKVNKGDDFSPLVPASNLNGAYIPNSFF